MFALMTNVCYMFFERFNCAFPDNKLKSTNHFKAKYFGITSSESNVWRLCQCLKSVEVKGLPLAPDAYERLRLCCVTLSHKISLTWWVSPKASLWQWRIESLTLLELVFYWCIEYPSHRIVNLFWCQIP